MSPALVDNKTKQPSASHKAPSLGRLSKKGLGFLYSACKRKGEDLRKSYLDFKYNYTWILQYLPCISRHLLLGLFRGHVGMCRDCRGISRAHGLLVDNHMENNMDNGNWVYLGTALNPKPWMSLKGSLLTREFLTRADPGLLGVKA